MTAWCDGARELGKEGPKLALVHHLTSYFF